MPLIICSVCGKQVSKRAVMCTGCGEPDPARYHMKNAWIGRFCWLFVWLSIGAVIWYKMLPLLKEIVNSLN